MVVSSPLKPKLLDLSEFLNLECRLRDFSPVHNDILFQLLKSKILGVSSLHVSSHHSSNIFCQTEVWQQVTYRLKINQDVNLHCLAET